VTGQIAQPGDVAVYEIGAGSETTSIDIVPTAPDDAEGRSQKPLDAEIELIGPSGIGPRFDDNGADGAELVPISGTDGRHIVVVRGFQTSTGPFTVRGSQVTPLTPAQPATGEIAPPTDVVQFAFEPSGGSSYAVEVSTDDEGFDPVLTVTPPSSEPLEVDSGGGGEPELFVLDGAAGRHVLSVSGYESSEGPFEIELVPVQPLEQGAFTGSGTAAFDVTVGDDLLVLSAAPDSVGDDVQLRVLDPEGNVFDEAYTADVEEPAGVVLTGAGADALNVIVGGSGGYTGTFAPAPKTPLQPGGSTQGSGTTAFEVTVGEDELLELRAEPNSDDVYLEFGVVDAEGDVIDAGSSFDAGEPVSIILTGEGSDAQRVIVRGAGGYTATLGPAQSRLLEPGGTTQANGTTVYDVDVGDEAVEFSAVPDSDDGWVYVRVIDADGSLIDEGYPDDVGGPATVTLNDLSGAHVIVQGDGDYTSSLSS
jgi:hypothetical protein